MFAPERLNVATVDFGKLWSLSIIHRFSLLIIGKMGTIRSAIYSAAPFAFSASSLPILTSEGLQTLRDPKKRPAETLRDCDLFPDGFGAANISACLHMFSTTTRICLNRLAS